MSVPWGQEGRGCICLIHQCITNEWHNHVCWMNKYIRLGVKMACERDCQAKSESLGNENDKESMLEVTGPWGLFIKTDSAKPLFFYFVASHNSPSVNPKWTAWNCSTGSMSLENTATLLLSQLLCMEKWIKITSSKKFSFFKDFTNASGKLFVSVIILFNSKVSIWFFLLFF